MKRKILSLILVFAMTVSLLTVGTGAVEPTYGDTAGHWAESSIERWSGHGIIQGSNGEFDPNGQLTCAQLATILAKLLKLPATKDAGFTDNTADAWYYDAINRCAAAGILNGNGDGTVTPEAPISRERAMVMLGRALGIEPIREPDLTKYTDAAKVAPYAQGMVAAMIEAGIVGGVTADELAPQANINRASTVTILDRAISTYADQAGATVKADGKGLVLVVAENVKITGAPEGTKIVVADGATGLTVNGKAVSDDQTYIVPKTEPAKPSSGSSGGGSSSPSHTHVWATEWSYSETHHWHNCTAANCTVSSDVGKASYAAHTFTYADNGDGNHTKSCSDCGYSTTEAHSYDESTNKCICGLEKPADNVVASVKAADGSCTYYSTLAGAVAAAADGGIVTLLNSQELSANLVFSTKVTLNLNGQAVETKGYAIQVQGSGDLTVTGNGTVNNDQEAVEVNNKKNYRTIFSVEGETAKLTIENGTFTTKASQAIFAEGTVTIHDGTFQNTAESVNEVLDSSAMITANGSAAAVTIYKASVIATAESTNAGIYGIYGANGAHITLKDGVEVHTSFAAIGMNNTTSNPEVVITVNGGTYKSECQQLDNSKHSKFNTVCYLPGKCHMTINGGTFTAGNEEMHVFSIPYAQAGMNLTIKDGTFTAGSNVFYSQNGNHSNRTTDNQIVVSGGSFTGTIAYFDENNTFSSFITGGTFSSDPSTYLAVGYKATKDESANTWTVEKMDGYAMIEGLAGWYETLTDAAKAWRESKGVVTSGNTFGANSLGTVDSITWTVSGVVATGDGEGVIGNNGAGQSILGGGYYTPAVTVNNITIKGVNGAKITKTGDSYLVSAAGKNTVYENITFVDTVRIDSNPAKLTFKNCTFEAGFRMPHSATNGEVTIENCTFTGNESSGYAIFAQGSMASFKVTNSTISNCQRGINVQAGNSAEVTISGNTIKNLTGKTENEFTYGSAIQLTSAKTFSVTGNTISDVAVNAFHIYSGCPAVSIEIKDNNISAAYLCWNEANYTNVTSSGNTLNISNAGKCVTKTAEIESTFALN